MDSTSIMYWKEFIYLLYNTGCGEHRKSLLFIIGYAWCKVMCSIVYYNLLILQWVCRKSATYTLHATALKIPTVSWSTFSHYTSYACVYPSTLRFFEYSFSAYVWMLLFEYKPWVSIISPKVAQQAMHSRSLHRDLLTFVFVGGFSF